MANPELQALLDACIDAVTIIDHLGTIETFNRAACHIFGYQEGEVIGRNFSMLMPEPDHGRQDQRITWRRSCSATSRTNERALVMFASLNA